MKKIRVHILIGVVLLCNSMLLQAMLGRVGRLGSSGVRLSALQNVRAAATPQAQSWRRWFSSWFQPRPAVQQTAYQKISPFAWGQQRGFSTSVVQKDEKLQDLLRKMQTVGGSTQEEQLANLKSRMNSEYAQIVSLMSKNQLPSIEQVEKLAELVKKSGGSVAADINKRYQNGSSWFRHLLYLTARYKGNPKIVHIFSELGGRCAREDYEYIMNNVPDLTWFKERINELGNKNYDDMKLSEVVKIADELHSISLFLQNLGFSQDMYATGKFNLWPLITLPSRNLYSPQSIPTQFYEKYLKNNTVGNLKRGETTSMIIYPGGRVTREDILKIFKEAGFVKEGFEQALITAPAKENGSVLVDNGVLALSSSSFNDMYNILYKNGVYQGPEDVFRKFILEYAPDKLKLRFDAGEISQEELQDMNEKVKKIIGARSQSK